MDYLLPAAIFVLCLLAIELVYYSVATLRRTESGKVHKRLKTLRIDLPGAAPLDILRKRHLSSVSWLDRFLRRLPGMQKLDKLLVQADLGITADMIILLSFLCVGITYFLLLSMSRNQPLSLLASLVCGGLPLFFIRAKKKKRMDQLENQLPDALELIGRTLRAGHAFSSGMKMVCEEFDDPIAMEFERTLGEINFGINVDDAMKNLADRVDSADLRYFVVSVIIQRGVGGNLAEVIDNIARIIRERFKLRGQIRVLSAEGRFSAGVLCLTPILLALFIRVVNPDYIKVLYEDPAGRVLATVVLILMLIGIFVIRKMIDIRV